MALELDCEVILKGTKVDGIYDPDPMKNGDAERYASLTYQEAVEKDAIKVMDKAALGLAMEQKMPLVVFDIGTDGNILKAALGEQIGTKVG